MKSNISQIAFAAFLGAFLFIAGCQTTRQPVSVYQTRTRSRAKEIQEAKRIAAEYIKNKQRQENPERPKEDKPDALRQEGPKPFKGNTASFEIKDPVWNAVRERTIDTAKPLALAELIDIALRNNPATRQAWHKAAAAVAQYKQAQSSLYPQASISADLTKKRVDSNLLSYNSNALHYGPNLQLTYLLLDFGGRSASIEEAMQQLVAADSQYNQAIQDLLLQVEEGYYGLYSTQSQLEAAESNAESAKKDLDAAQQRLDAGLGVKLDVLQAQSDYDDALYTLEDTKSKVKTAKATLAQALGLAADTEFTIAAPSRELPTDITVQDISQLIDGAMEKRPDIASGRASLAAKRAALKAADSDLWPTLSLGGSVVRNWYDYHKTPSSNERDYTYTGLLTMNWDIFDGFNSLNKKRQAQAELDAEQERLMQAELAASADVWTRYHNLSAAVSKLKYSQALAESAGASYELALESYKTGVKTILDLIHAQDQFSDAKSKLIQSKQDVFVALAELSHATGSLTTENKGDGTTRTTK